MSRTKAELVQIRAALDQAAEAPTAPDSGQPERVSPPPGGAGVVDALEPKS